MQVKSHLWFCILKLCHVCLNMHMHQWDSIFGSKWFYELEIWLIWFDFMKEIWMTSIWVCSLYKAIAWKNAVNSLVTLCLFCVEKSNLLLNLLLREKVIQEWNDTLVFMFYSFNGMTSIKYGIMRLRIGNEIIQFQQKKGEIRREERGGEEKREWWGDSCWPSVGLNLFISARDNSRMESGRWIRTRGHKFVQDKAFPD